MFCVCVLCKIIKTLLNTKIQIQKQLDEIKENLISLYVAERSQVPTRMVLIREMFLFGRKVSFL